jgi:hypothetical protein
MRYLVLGLLVFASSISIAAPRASVDLGWKRTLYTFDALEDQPFDVDLNHEVVGAVSDDTTFTADGLPDWLEIKGSHLEGFPDVDVLHVPTPFTLTVTTSHGVASVPAQVQVMYAITPATWTASTLTLPNAVVGQLYTVDLSQFVANPDQDLLDYNKFDKPEWLNLSDAGILSGTPTATDVGTASFYVDVWGSTPQPGPSQATATVIVGQSASR